MPGKGAKSNVNYYFDKTCWLKDQCDVCFKYKNDNIEAEEYKEHIDRKKWQDGKKKQTRKKQ